MFNKDLLTHKKQENHGQHYKFDSQIVATSNFVEQFAPVMEDLIQATISSIFTRVNSTLGADYLQIFEYDGKVFWVIDDMNVITFLMPEDY